MSRLWSRLSLAVEIGAILDIDIDTIYHKDLSFNYLCIGLCSYLHFLIDMRAGDSFLIGRFELGINQS
jgi:hypothetical protein